MYYFIDIVFMTSTDASHDNRCKLHFVDSDALNEDNIKVKLIHFTSCNPPAENSVPAISAVERNSSRVFSSVTDFRLRRFQSDPSLTSVVCS